MPREKVIEANKTPYNLKYGQSSPLLLHYEGDSCEVHIGGNHFTTKAQGEYSESIPLMIDGTPIIAFVLQDNQLLLNINIFDEYNQIVMRIVNNQLYYSTSPWDIQLIGKTLTIREKYRKFLLRIRFEPPNKIIIDKGRFLYNGVEVLVDSDYILLTNNCTYIKGNSEKNCHGGLIIGPTLSPIGGFMTIQGISRYQCNSKEAIEWAKSLEKDLL